MTIQLATIDDVQALPAQKLDALPISIGRRESGQLDVVSRYGDAVWDFYPYLPQANKKVSDCRLHWAVKLPDGTRLTDPVHEHLLRASKAFIWSLFADPVEGRTRPAMTTLRDKLTHLSQLLRWMVSQKLTRFVDLAERAIDYVPYARLHWTGRGTVIPETTAHRLTMVEDLYNQSGKLDDGLPCHPWPDESAHSLAGVRKTGKPKTKYIEDDVAERLVAAALHYVRERAPTIIEAERRCIEAIGNLPLSRGYRRVKQARKQAAIDLGYASARELISESLHLRTACYVIIDLFSGIRDSEMSSIEVGCVRRGKARDGLTDVLWLHGTIYKTGVRPKRWLVPELVDEAVQVLTKLSEPLRDRFAKEEASFEVMVKKTAAADRNQYLRRLHQVRKYKNKLFLGVYQPAGPKVTIPSSSFRNQHLRLFCAHTGVLGPEGKPAHLNTHMFRRTYARNVARAELGDLLTLKEHFGHWSLDMTVFYADGGTDDYEADTELLDMVVEEKLMRQQQIMSSLLDSDAPLANGSHWLKEWRGSVRTAQNKESLIAEYAGTVTLNGTGHSWCVGNSKKTGCGGLCIFEAQMCVECNYGIISQEHRPVWEGIKDQQLEALALDDMGPGGRERAQTILRYADKVLKRLDGQEAA